MNNFGTSDVTTDNAYSYTNSKGQTYYLHSKDVTLKNGRVQTIYFFAREVREGALEAVPAGYMVVETKRTGMPVLKKEPKDE
jgi:hypothetical protein